MSWLDSVAVFGVSALISEFVGFDPAWFHLRLCSKEMHSLCTGRIRVDHKQLEDVINRQLCNLEFLEPCEGFRFESNVLASVGNTQTVLRFLNSKREQVKKLHKNPIWIQFAVRNTIQASDLEFLKWLSSFARLPRIPDIYGNQRIEDNPELIETLIGLRNGSPDIEEWESMIKLCVRCNLSKCLDYVIERGPIRNLWDIQGIYFAICDRKDLNMLEECFRLQASLEEEDFLFAFERSLEVGWTEGALWLISRVKDRVPAISLVRWVRHQEQEPDIAIFSRLVKKVDRPLNGIMDVMISKGFWKHVEILQKMGVKYSSKFSDTALVLPRVFEESKLTDGMMKSMFGRIFSDILFLRHGLSLGKVVDGLEAILDRCPCLATDPVDQVWMPIGIIVCYTPPEVTERDGTSCGPCDYWGDVWTLTVPDKEEEAARERIIKILMDSGANPSQILVGERKKCFQRRSRRYRRFLRFSPFTVSEVMDEDPNPTDSSADDSFDFV